jgi:uronate dehydrogenase
MKSVLLTGAAGKVGCLLRPTLSQTYALRLLDRCAVDGDPGQPGMTFVGDMNDAALLDRAMSGVDTVIHLAGAASASTPFDELVSTNIIGTYNVYEAARRKGVSRVVFASSNRTVENHSPLRSFSTCRVHSLLTAPHDQIRCME